MIKRDNGHSNADAFMLYTYACVRGRDLNMPEKGGTMTPCGHREIIWNSRDGVTPFATTCPSCGGTMHHVEWGLDKYAPDHKLHMGQKFWTNMTIERAHAVAQRAIVTAGKLGYPKPSVDRIVESCMEPPGQPMMDVYMGQEMSK